jgi:hypothetical protein
VLRTVACEWQAVLLSFKKREGITLIACVAADGSDVRTSLILTRRTYEDELVEYGLTSEKLEVYSRRHAYIDRDIFFDWPKDTMVHELNKRRMAYDYLGPAFLLLDNCSAHFGGDISTMAEESNLRLLYIPPPSSRFLQCLDISVFLVAERAIARINRAEAVNVQTLHIIQLVNSFLSAAVPTNIVKSLKNLGISLRSTELEIGCITTPDPMRMFNSGKLAREVL